MNPSRTIAVTIATAALAATAGCGKGEDPKAAAPTAAPPAAAAAVPSSTLAQQSTTVPFVPTRKADKPSRRNLPKKVRRRDVRDLAERFTKAWTTLELGNGDPKARRELAEAITPQFAGELAQIQLQPREDPAELVDVDVIRHSGSARRWTAVVRLLRHGSTEYLQPEIARQDGRLVVTGLSW